MFLLQQKVPVKAHQSNSAISQPPARPPGVTIDISAAATGSVVDPTAVDPTPGPVESLQTRLAKNLVVARVAAGVTQQALAAAADVSRATIAQVETGCADPRLSTISALATALGIPATTLLFGSDEVQAFARPNPTDSAELPDEDLVEVHRLLRTGMLRDRVEAGRVAATSLQLAGHTRSAVTLGAMLTAIVPGTGTELGVAAAATLHTLHHRRTQG
jgi:transcriptional regulator with XRE-family HTH domain